MSQQAQDLIQEVRKLASLFPDAVYDRDDMSSCAYETGHVRNGPDEEGCVFGQAARVLGILDKFPVESDGGNGIATVFDDYLHVPMTEEEQEWMTSVQEFQDSSRSWSYAVDGADQDVGRIHALK